MYKLKLNYQRLHVTEFRCCKTIEIFYCVLQKICIAIVMIMMMILVVVCVDRSCVVERVGRSGLSVGGRYAVRLSVST